MIIANETRSRRSWMNSLISIAQVRRQKPPRRRCAVAERHAHWKLSLRLAHQVDEHVLERGLRAASRSGPAGRDRARSQPRAPPRRVRTRAGWCRTARPCRCRGVGCSSSASLARSSPFAALTVVGGEMRGRDHLLDRAVRQQHAIGDIGDLVAALGLVHVVGRDEHGEALARRAHGSRSRIRAAPWDRRPRSARRAGGVAGSAACRRRARAAASSRRKARRRAAPRGPSSPSRSIMSRAARTGWAIP